MPSGRHLVGGEPVDSSREGPPRFRAQDPSTLQPLEPQFADGPSVWSTSSAGPVLSSVRGTHYALTVSQALSIGYAYPEKQRVELFLTESFAFRVLESRAAVALRRA